MWFPSAKLVMPKQRFNENEKVLYTDKDGNVHNAKVLSVRFKSLNTGYFYCIETEEPINGISKSGGGIKTPIINLNLNTHFFFG